MTKILIDEATVKQVLEALESCGAAHITDGGNQWYDEKFVDKAITALKALAEQPAQQSCYCLNCEELSKQVTALKLCVEVERGFHAQEQTAQQEPFGYFKVEPFGWTDCAETDEGAVALYTSPQPAQTAQRKPLTDDEIWGFWCSRPEIPEGEDDSMEAEFVAAVRRVLAAHNIKENT